MTAVSSLRVVRAGHREHYELFEEALDIAVEGSAQLCTDEHFMVVILPMEGESRRKTDDGHRRSQANSSGDHGGLDPVPTRRMEALPDERLREVARDHDCAETAKHQTLGPRSSTK